MCEQDRDLLFDLHEIYWFKVWDHIRHGHLDDKKLPEWIADQLDIHIEMSSDGKVTMQWMDYDHEIETEFDLKKYIQNEIEMRQGSDGSFQDPERTTIFEYKQTLETCLKLITDALERENPKP